jgi:hypothetical protein
MVLGVDDGAESDTKPTHSFPDNWYRKSTISLSFFSLSPILTLFSSVFAILLNCHSQNVSFLKNFSLLSRDDFLICGPLSAFSKFSTFPLVLFLIYLLILSLPLHPTHILGLYIFISLPGKSISHKVKYGGRSPKFVWAPCHVTCTAVLIGWDPVRPPPAWGLVYESAIGQQR